MKIIHRLWLGPVAMPDKYVEYGARWRSLNSDWVVHDWTEATLPPLLNRDVYDNIGKPGEGEELNAISVATQRADVLGYELIWRYGGVYVNCDIEPVRPLDVLFSKVSFDEDAWATHEDETYLVNAAIGGPAKHPFWAHVVSELPKRYWENPRGQMNEVTGPHLLTACARWWTAHEQPGFVTLPIETFNPVHFHQIPPGGDAEGLFTYDQLPENTIGVHHWGHRLTGRPNAVNERV